MLNRSPHITRGKRLIQCIWRQSEAVNQVFKEGVG